jgi:hypothetical protein
MESSATEPKILDKKERWKDIKSRADEYEIQWDKDGVIQYKNEKIAILQRSWGEQMEFIVAYDDLTSEGYRLMAIDEGKSAGGGFSGGANAYFYFQRINYVK